MLAVVIGVVTKWLSRLTKFCTFASITRCCNFMDKLYNCDCMNVTIFVWRLDITWLTVGACSAAGLKFYQREQSHLNFIVHSCLSKEWLLNLWVLFLLSSSSTARNMPAWLCVKKLQKALADIRKNLSLSFNYFWFVCILIN